jgi:hypothetical protein
MLLCRPERRRRRRCKSRGRLLYRGPLRTRVLRGRRGFWFFDSLGRANLSRPSKPVVDVK